MVKSLFNKISTFTTGNPKWNISIWPERHPLHKSLVSLFPLHHHWLYWYIPVICTRNYSFVNPGDRPRALHPPFLVVDVRLHQGTLEQKQGDFLGTIPALLLCVVSICRNVAVVAVVEWHTVICRMPRMEIFRLWPAPPKVLLRESKCVWSNELVV